MCQDLEACIASARSSMVEGNLGQAQKYFEQALALTENGNISLNKYLDCLIGLSEVYCQTGALNKGEAAINLALATIQKQVGKEHYLYASHLNNLAAVRLRQDRLKEAEQVLLEAIVIIEKCFDSGHPELLKPLENLGHIYQEQKHIPKALQSWERAISIRERCFGADDPGIKFYKNVCRKANAAARQVQKKSKNESSDEGVQLTLFV